MQRPSARSIPGVARTLVLVATSALTAIGCASSAAIERARGDFRSGNPDAALQVLASDKVAERDRLVALMEGGLIAQSAGRIDDSIRQLREAAELIERIDAVYVGEQGAALVVNDRVTRYRGEYAERLWIRTVQMLNYLVLGDWQGAAVEARQAIEVFERYGEPLAGDVFTRALLARVLDAAGDPGAAAIEYGYAFERSGGQSSVAALARPAALRAGRPEDVKRYDEVLSRATAEVARAATPRSGQGSLLLVVATGQVPPKRAGNLFLAPDLRISFPYYPDYVRSAFGDTLEVRVDGERAAMAPIVTRLGTVAEASLAARAKQVAARQTLRAVTKQGIGAAASKENEALGVLVGAALMLLEEADTRSWQTLPGRWALVEQVLPAGEHRLEVQAGLDRRVVLEAVPIRAGATSVIVLGEGSGGLSRIVPRAAPAPLSGPAPVTDRDGTLEAERISSLSR